MTKSAKSVKYHPKKTFVDAKTQKLLPIGSKITHRVVQWSHQHTQGSKIDQRSQQFYLCKLFGVVAIFATKINES